MAVVTATLEAPFGDRGNEGSLRFNVEFSPMASPAFEPGARCLGPARCCRKAAVEAGVSFERLRKLGASSGCWHDAKTRSHSCRPPRRGRD